MAYTRATKAKRLASLDEQITESINASVMHDKRAQASRDRTERLTKERDWLAQAPVSDPLPEDGGAE
jgi:hypothetical protein